MLNTCIRMVQLKRLGNSLWPVLGVCPVITICVSTDLEGVDQNDEEGTDLRDHHPVRILGCHPAQRRRECGQRDWLRDRQRRQRPGQLPVQPSLVRRNMTKPSTGTPPLPPPKATPVTSTL